MNFLNLNLRKIVLLFVACLLPLISINVQQKPVESNWVSRPFFLLSQGIQGIFYFFSADVRSTTGLYLNLINIKKDNRELSVNNQKLQAEIQILSEKNLEIDRLRKLLDFKQSTPMKLIAAEIIGKDLIADHNTLTINKGTAQGIKSGMGVITLDGVVGYIFRPEVNRASIMLVSDRYAVVDGVVQRTRARGIVEGKGTQECSLKYVERTEDVKTGDVIVTGGLDNLFPKGFPIATVETVERKTHSVSLKVELRPIVDPSKVEEVFVIADAEEQDLANRFAPPPPEATTPPTGNGQVAAAGTAGSTTTTLAPTTTSTTTTTIPPKPKPKPKPKSTTTTTPPTTSEPADTDEAP